MLPIAYTLARSSAWTKSFICEKEYFYLDDIFMEIKSQNEHIVKQNKQSKPILNKIFQSNATEHVKSSLQIPKWWHIQLNSTFDNS